MHTFFHGWRRKAGCVTLLIALALMGLWLRSQVYGDFIAFARSSRSNHFLASFQDGVKWINSYDPLVSAGIPPRFAFSMEDDIDADQTLMPIFGGDVIRWRNHWQALGFHFGAGSVSGYQFTAAIIPYWSLTITMTLLSAYLILWQPRKKRITQ